MLSSFFFQLRLPNFPFFNRCTKNVAPYLWLLGTGFSQISFNQIAHFDFTNSPIGTRLTRNVGTIPHKLSMSKGLYILIVKGTLFATQSVQLIFTVKHLGITLWTCEHKELICKTEDLRWLKIGPRLGIMQYEEIRVSTNNKEPFRCDKATSNSIGLQRGQACTWPKNSRNGNF